MVAYLLLGG